MRGFAAGHIRAAVRSAVLVSDRLRKALDLVAAYIGWRDISATWNSYTPQIFQLAWTTTYSYTAGSQRSIPALTRKHLLYPKVAKEMSNQS